MTTKESIVQVFEEIVDASEHIDINFIFVKFSELSAKPIEKLSDEEVLEILIEIQNDTIY